MVGVCENKRTLIWPAMALVLMAFLFFVLTDVQVLNLRSLVRAGGGMQYGLAGGLSYRRQPYDVTRALVHYATTTVTPQQSKAEITVTSSILSRRGPCNLLVYGLGFDSPLWQALNAGGVTVFLEEDPQWIAQVAKDHPHLTAYHVNYSTALKEADALMRYAKQRLAHDCNPAVDLRSSTCRLAITSLPARIYDIQWDVIMVDAPKGYYAEAPGRMSSIFTSAVMAREPPRGAPEAAAHAPRQRVTDVLVHDMDRPVEIKYAAQFLCPHNQIARVGRLAHFQIFADPVGSTPSNKVFCTSS